MGILREQLPFWAAGLYLGVIALALQWLANLPFGATGAVVGVIDFAARPARGPSWRVFFFVGIALGALAHAALTHRYQPSLTHAGFEAAWGASLAGKAAILAAAGLVMGFGARIAGGCTSGHGICGMARGSTASLVSMMTFMAVAVGTAQALSRLLGTVTP